jgi:hypothetical protein
VSCPDKILAIRNGAGIEQATDVCSVLRR